MYVVAVGMKYFIHKSTKEIIQFVLITDICYNRNSSYLLKRGKRIDMNFKVIKFGKDVC